MDNYYRAHPEARIVDAAIIAEQRRYGRQLGADIHVNYRPEWDGCFAARVYASWLRKYGAASGVYIHRTEKRQDQTSSVQ